MSLILMEIFCRFMILTAIITVAVIAGIIVS